MALSLRFLAILLYTILLPAAVLSFSISNGGVLQRSSDGILGARRRGAIRVSCSASEARGAPKVALTRELGKNSKLEVLLKEHGVETMEIPCITFETGADFDKLSCALSDSEWEFVVITSPEAAAVFLPVWEEVGRPALRVASVGAGTRAALQAGGLDPVFTPSKATGKNLADELPGPAGNGRVLYPASAKARSEVQGGLTARGFSCTRLNTYDTVSAAWDEELLARARAADVVALASPSAVKTWTERVGTEQSCACIGSTSATACREAGFERVFFPSNPGVEGWAQSVMDAISVLK